MIPATRRFLSDVRHANCPKRLLLTLAQPLQEQGAPRLPVRQRLPADWEPNWKKIKLNLFWWNPSGPPPRGVVRTRCWSLKKEEQGETVEEVRPDPAPLTLDL